MSTRVSRVARDRLYRPVRRRVRRRLRRGGILMYHRICSEPCDPWAITVAPADFAEQLAVLAEARAVVDLAAFAGPDAYTRDGAQLAVTFDDGYVDNLEAALPILEHYEIPATLFVVADAIGRRREFWWDALQRAVLESGPLPPELAFEFGTGPQVYSVAAEPAELVDHSWRADESPARTPRQRLFGQLWSAIVPLRLSSSTIGGF
ncbi:MAG: polysaccharide deacetylase family protein [Microlunatus sp.]